MNQNGRFVVKRFKNRNGTTSWRVSGWLHGLRIRRNFRTREEVAAERSVLEIKALQASGQHTVVTTLSEEQVRESEAVFRRLVGNAHTLSFYTDFALTNHREPVQGKLLSDAIAECIEAKRREMEQEQLSKAHFGRIQPELKRMHGHFLDATIANIAVPDLVALLELGHTGMKTYNNRRGVLSTFFRFAFQRGWTVQNPILKVQHHRIYRRSGVAQTLTAAQARALMERVESVEAGRMVIHLHPARRRCGSCPCGLFADG